MLKILWNVELSYIFLSSKSRAERREISVPLDTKTVQKTRCFLTVQEKGDF